MTNHITNVIIEGADSFTPYLSKDISNETYFDFNKIIPMPKELEDTSSPAYIVSEEEYLEYLYNLEKSDNKEVYKRFNNCLTKQKSNELIAKYGYNNWFDWSNNNWGTKWNSYRCNFVDSDDKQLQTFCTASSPPIPVLQKLAILTNTEIVVICKDEGNDEIYELVFEPSEEYSHSKTHIATVSYDDEDDEDDDCGEYCLWLDDDYGHLRSTIETHFVN